VWQLEVAGVALEAVVEHGLGRKLGIDDDLGFVAAPGDVQGTGAVTAFTAADLGRLFERDGLEVRVPGKR